LIVEKTFDAGEVTLNYAEGLRSGPPLLLLHGTANRWQAFTPLLPHLVERWHIYALDHRGHGGSGRANRYGFGFYYGDAVRFVDEVIREPAVVFGHSLGGRIALKMAADDPSSTRAIILGDSSLSPPTPSPGMGGGFMELAKTVEENRTVKAIYTALSRRAGDGFDPVHGLTRAKSLSMADPLMLRSIAEHMEDLDSPYSHFHGYDPDELLPKVRCPTLILQAEKGMLKDEEVEKALSILPEAYHVKLFGMPHEFLAQQTEPVLRAVTAFLETLM
jgi:pimeloyl-ACP methyl ester carboxylesterase